MRPLTTDFLNLKIDVWRYAHYYEQNVLVVNLAILAIGFCSFALPATETSSRTDLTLNVLFGCVGIRFVVDESLPRLPYNTALQGTTVWYCKYCVLSTDDGNRLLRRFKQYPWACPTPLGLGPRTPLKPTVTDYGTTSARLQIT